jgi:hypothetical protein
MGSSYKSPVYFIISQSCRNKDNDWQSCFLLRRGEVRGNGGMKLLHIKFEIFTRSWSKFKALWNQYECRGPLVHAYNPSYSRGRDQEDHGSKSALANSLRNPMWKIFHTKKGWGMAQAIECLPREHGALSSNSSMSKRASERGKV